MSYATHLEGSIDGSRHAVDRLQGLHEGRPLLVRYDLERIRDEVPRSRFDERPGGLWRYRELLPVAVKERPRWSNATFSDESSGSSSCS
ncbi:MAG: hypothetical protein ACYTFV_13335 [Planctomycetota bacterium]